MDNNSTRDLIPRHQQDAKFRQILFSVHALYFGTRNIYLKNYSQ